MISPLAKVNRIRMRFDPALKKAIKLCSQLGGEGIADLSKVPISIEWQDGLPQDEKEMSEIMAVRTGQKATISVASAIRRLDGLSNTDMEQEMAAIEEDESRNNPLSEAPFSGGNEPPAGEE